jgi:hypothetical protein
MDRKCTTDGEFQPLGFSFKIEAKESTIQISKILQICLPQPWATQIGSRAKFKLKCQIKEK